MRGKLFSNKFFLASLGITPADAGKTFQSYLAQNTGKDHPRGCGENYSPIDIFSSTRGSPPRMRGKLEFENQLSFESGITPADAGKTARASRGRQTKQDHPRGCGENSDKDLLNFFKSGSPPRMRGKLSIGFWWNLKI